jgi:UDP:flavonoid glycosyltransferase YjiC (YdhE family)
MYTRFAGGNLALVPQPVDLNDVAQQCDAAILHGGHGATVYFLLHGKPLVLIPTQLEQRLTSDRVAQLELGLGASQNSSPEIQRAIQRLICQLPRFQSRAASFAGRYNALRSTDQADRATEAISHLLA